MATNPRVDPATDLIVPEPPRLPAAPAVWEAQYQDQYTNVLRLYFNRLNNLLQEINVSTGSGGIYPLGTAGDAFGRLRTSNPFTLFDSKNRFHSDPQFDTVTTGAGASATYVSNDASVTLQVDATASEDVTRQTLRVFSYQPGKSLLVFATFAMGAANSGVDSKIGYFDGSNGIYFRRNGSTLYFEIMKNGSVTETVAQSSWNTDKMDGTGASGVTLDVTKTQILYIDLEWLGVGTVRCGFVQDGKLYVCHAFHHANTATSVYMQTAVLPVRYQITSSGTGTGNATLSQICSTVMSEGGYNRRVAPNWIRSPSPASIGTSFVPLFSMRIKSGKEGAVIIPASVSALPVGTNLDFEVALFKYPDASHLTGATWALTSGLSVEYDTAATTMSIVNNNIVSSTYLSGSNQGSTSLSSEQEYNFGLQIGVDIANVSEVYTLAARTLSGSGLNNLVGGLSYYDLTD